MKTVYIAHPLGAGADRGANRIKATEYVMLAANRGFAPIADWILLSGVWGEDKREQGLAIDKTLVEKCDEVWLCGSRVSPGMLIEARHAFYHGIPTYRVELNSKDYRVWGEDEITGPGLPDVQP